jgi:O-antigen ligase
MDFLCLAVLVSRSRDSIWWFVLGLGIGGVLFLRFVVGASSGLWKFGYAEPMGFIAVAGGALLSWKLASLWLFVLGLKSMFSDYRSFGAICFLVAAYLWVRSARPSQPLAGGGSFVKLALAGGLAIGLVMVLLSATGGNSSGRRDESNAGRRAAFEVGLMAIGESPIIGHGSWTENRELAKRYLERQLELRGLKNTGWQSGTIFNPHSQVLHAWVEGGLLGAVFFLALFVSLLKSTPWLLQQRSMDVLTPILLFFVIMTLWNLYMSPFSAPHRIFIAFGGVLAALIAWQRQDADRAAAVPIRPAVKDDSPLPVSLGAQSRKLQLRNSRARVCMRKTSGARMRFER